MRAERCIFLGLREKLVSKSKLVLIMGCCSPRFQGFKFSPFIILGSDITSKNKINCFRTTSKHIELYLVGAGRVDDD